MRTIRIALVAVVAVCLALPGLAKEGADQYPNGAENWLAGALPPPGTYFVNYFGYYSGELKDGSGHSVQLPNGSRPSVDAWFDALRIVYVTNVKVLGGLLVAHAIVPVVSQRFDLGGGERTAGIGEMTFGPFDVAWHGKRFHAVAGVDVNVPTGAWDANDARKCIGANYVSYEPLFAVSWLPATGWEVSVKAMYNIKEENRTTAYKSGNEFHLDYLVGRHIGKWGLGVSGYYLKQVTDDRQNGVKVPANPGLWGAGRRGEVFAVGPSVIQNIGSAIVVVQWQHEINARNRFGGDKFWIKAIVPL